MGEGERVTSERSALMLGRLSYILRETYASFRRNVTLTAAAIITSAISLLIFGLTLYMQKGFDKLLAQWEDGVEMVVFVRAGSSDDQLTVIEDALSQSPLIEQTEYCDTPCALAKADDLYRFDQTTRALLTETNIPTQFEIVPTEATDIDEMRTLSQSLTGLPNVSRIAFPEDQIDEISRLKGFAGLYTIILSIALLIAAILLIWNTIRTAMVARRREIEVMKLVGATDWFIRVPFMLEGLIQGFLGGFVACTGLWLINNRWTAGLEDFPDASGFKAMYVDSGFQTSRMLAILLIGMAAGAIGSGIAASRFLDV